jgi:hypothetical protein
MPELVDVVRVLVEVRRRPEVLADRVPVDVEVVRVGEDEPVDGVEPQDEGRHLERGNQVALLSPVSWAPALPGAVSPTAKTAITAARRSARTPTISSKNGAVARR